MLALELGICLCSMLLAFDELGVVQPTLYAAGAAMPSPSLLRACLTGAAALGCLGPRRVSLFRALLLASLGMAASAPLYHWAFLHGTLAHSAPLFASVATSYALGCAARALPKALERRLSKDGMRRVLLHPTLGAGLLASMSLAGISTHLVGPLRASLAIGGGLIGTALISAAEGAHGAGQAKAGDPPAQRARWLGYGLFAVYSVAAFLLEQRLPLHRVLTSSHPIIAYANSERCSFEVTSGQGARHLFVDGELRLSTFDQRRWAESMVAPALARAVRPRRALVLSTGEGLLERELLKDDQIESIVSVTRCRLVADIAKSSAWMRQLNGDALNSPRVTLIERDPAAYLASAEASAFDLLIVDLPDPSGPLQTKYYSRYFYRQLAERMHDGSILVVQATSARRSPRTFATIGATLRAAGLVTRSAMVPLISRGEWSLYFAARQALPEVTRAQFLAGTLAGSIPEQFWNPWPDTLAPREFIATASTLYDAKVLDWFERESEISHGR